MKNNIFLTSIFF